MKPLQAVFSGFAAPDLMSGLLEADDAAVYRISDDRALIFTTDYFTPIVDDPYLYGSIAAANSMSDVYAMGGEVLLALNIAGFPEALPEDMVIDILRGGAEKVKEAGGVIAGGHTIDSKEPFFGLAVCGVVHPALLMEKSGAEPGDRLVLTKPIGSGLIATALKGDLAGRDHVEAACRSMVRLNRHAAAAARCAKCRCATDITGFGLIGHALDIAQHSGMSLKLDSAGIPLLDGVRQYADQWLFPGGANRNSSAYRAKVEFDQGIPEETRMILFTPETSGGLLCAIKPERIDTFMAECKLHAQPAWIIGEVMEPASAMIRID